MFAVWAAIDGDDDPLHDGDGALALYAWTWIGELVANLFIWRRPQVAAAGGLAMGAVAVPALRGSGAPGAVRVVVVGAGVGGLAARGAAGARRARRDRARGGRRGGRQGRALGVRRLSRSTPGRRC